MERAKQVTMTDLNAAIGVRQPSAHPSRHPLAGRAGLPQTTVPPVLPPSPGLETCPVPSTGGVGCSPLPLVPSPSCG